MGDRGAESDEALPFHRLHRPGEPLILPCAWDVASARLFAEAGHPAIGTTSLGVAAGIGAAEEDRETLTVTASLIADLSRALPEPAVLAAKVRAIKEAFPDLFVNARIDTFWIGQDDLGDVIDRIRVYAEAGVARISTGSLLYGAAISAALQSLSGLDDDRPAQTGNVLSYRAISELGEAVGSASEQRNQSSS